MDTTEPIPPTPPASADPETPWIKRRLTGREPIHRSTWLLALAAALTVASMLIAAEVGAMMGIFGLGWGVLALATVLLLAGILVRRQAMLPLSLVATALTLPAAALTLSHTPLDRSAGLLIVRPTEVSAINGKTFHRGIGSIFLDLRGLEFAGAQTIRVAAHADIGRVIVALPRDRCVGTTIRATRLAPPPDRLRLAFAAIGKDHLVTDGQYATFTWTDWALPSNEASGEPQTLIAYGKSRDDEADPATATFSRHAPADAPVLQLDLRGTSTATVRDYPKQVGPLTPIDQSGPQVGDQRWPAAIKLPDQPGDLTMADAWHHTWTSRQIADKVPAKWAAWEHATIAGQAALSRRAAGVCASARELAGYWSTTRFGAFDSRQLFDEYGSVLDGTGVADTLRNGGRVFDENGRVLGRVEITTRQRLSTLPSEYLVSVNGLGQVRRQEVRADGSYAPSTMTAANPGGA